MNKDFAAWLAGQTMPMFDIRKATGNALWDKENARYMDQAWEVFQSKPRKSVTFECTLDELADLIEEHFPMLRNTVGRLAVDRAISDLRIDPWWGSAGPITEEMRFLLREGFKSLNPASKVRLLKSPVRKQLDHVPA